MQIIAVDGYKQIIDALIWAKLNNIDIGLVNIDSVFSAEIIMKSYINAQADIGYSASLLIYNAFDKIDQIFNAIEVGFEHIIFKDLPKILVPKVSQILQQNQICFDNIKAINLEECRNASDTRSS